MKFFNRNIPLTDLPFKTWQVIRLTVAVTRICKKPGMVLKAYFLKHQLDFVELRNGYKIFLSSNKDDISTFVVVFCKHEYGRFGNKKVIIDVGANIGMFSLYAICCGAETVYAFEPNKESFNTIEKTIAANHLSHRFKVFNLAVSNISGQEIFIPKKSSPLNVSRHTVAEGLDSHDAVKTISLEDFIRELNPVEINVLKVDCEGAEYVILPSLSKETAALIKEIKMEFHGSEIQLREWFTLHGFNITRYWCSHARKDIGYFWAEK